MHAHRKRDTTAPLSARKRFGKYKEETGRATRNVRVQRSESLGRLMAAWEKYDFSPIDYTENLYEKRNFRRAWQVLHGMEISSRDVAEFCVAVAEFQDMAEFSDRAGHLISAMIRKSPDQDFALHTGHFERPLRFLGFCNSKNVVIEGSVGAMLGTEMSGGMIEVKGDAGYNVGTCMSGGIIEISGDAGRYLGDRLKAGKIIVDGSALGDVGGMGWATGFAQGGEIHVNGDRCDVRPIIDEYRSKKDFYRENPELRTTVRIFHKGKLVFSPEQFL